MGSPLQASITGLQGVCCPRWVSAPNDTAASRTTRTAIGRRFQLFSPSPAKNGSPIRTMRPTAGPIKRTGVSIEGGRNDSNADGQRKKKAGRGDVWMMVGSGWPPGPIGPGEGAEREIDKRM